MDSLTISGIKTQPPGFQNSFVAAYSLGTVAIADLPTDGTASGGLAGRVLLRKYTRKAGGKIVKSRTGPLNTAGNLEDPVDSFFARLV